jgi:2-oxoglutarate ferredoxin oxidoreductase subunit beta
VARLYAGTPEMITAALVEGVKSPGFSFFHVYSACVTFDKSFKTWNNLKKWTHPLADGYDPTDYRGAVAEVLDNDFSLGVIYRR